MIGKRALALASAAFAVAASGADSIVVGSKSFRESYILGEALARLLRAEGFEARHQQGLGGTKICYDALLAGEIDVYVEYTGTIAQGIKNIPDATWDQLVAALAADGVEMFPSFGFNNTYALAVSTDAAATLGLSNISDLAAHGDLRLAVSHEFLERRDGWPGLRERYDLPQSPDGVEHSLAYRAIADGALDGTDVYSTDGEWTRYPLTLLRDDLGFFAPYLAVPLARADLPPAARAVLVRVAGTLDEAEMRALNAAARSNADVARVAERYVASIGGGQAAAGENAQTPGLWARLGANTARHLVLVVAALAPAAITAVLLAVLIFNVAWLSRAAVYLAGLMQTVPSIALLALFIPLFGIGPAPAVVALFLYALLPILRNAVTALDGIDPTLRRVASAMGLTRIEELRLVFVPLAMPTILAGVRTAAVITIGTATLAAFIGAGGLGDPIVTGLTLNDTQLILQGAIPAALLAVATELLFEGLERSLVPGHLRLRGPQ